MGKTKKYTLFKAIFRYIYMKTKYEIFLQWNTKTFLQKVLFLLHFGPCQNCMSSANLVAEIHLKLCTKWDLSTGEPCTCEYVTLLQSFHRGTLNIHWHIAQNLQPTFSMSVLFRRLFRTTIFSRFSQVAIATSNFMNEFYHGGFMPEVSVSMFKESIALVRNYVSETRK